MNIETSQRVLSSVDRRVRRIGVLDKAVGLIADRLIPKAIAKAYVQCDCTYSVYAYTVLCSNPPCDGSVHALYNYYDCHDNSYCGNNNPCAGHCSGGP